MNIDDLMLAAMGTVAILCARGMAKASKAYYEKLGIDCPSLKLLTWFYRFVGMLMITIQFVA